jgi:hypothetical protein
VRGHEPIIELRRRGQRPVMIWIDCDGYNPGFAALARMGFPVDDHVELQATDQPHRMDWRFVTGLVVKVDGSQERRVAAVARACAEAGARQVIAAWSTVQPRGEEFDVTVHRITFTNDELSEWPQ